MNKVNRNLAPVAIFVYNRLSNTKGVIEALQENYLAKDTDVFVFSDGPKTEKQADSVNKVRSYLKTVIGFKSFTIVEREQNYYIERNIIEGVTEIINRFGKVIVLEDDGVSARNFLSFMNEALDHYQEEKRIMHIATFTFIKLPTNFRKTFFWTYSENTGGGWATWKDRWDKFKWYQNEKEALDDLTEEQRKKIELDGVTHTLGFLKLKPIPWDICWNIAINRNNGLSVNSPGALIKNSGLFNGTHFTAFNRILGKSPFEVELDKNEEIIFDDNVIESKQALELLKEFYGKMGTRKRDRVLHYFVRTLVVLRITKVLKRIFK